ncbi:MAG: DUF421 domain-containing protein [Christensenellales bacterium]
MWNDIVQTALKSVVSVVVLFVLTRIMGKQQIAQLTFFDYVVGISIGSLAGAFAVDNVVTYPIGLTGMVIFALFSILLSYLSLKSYRARKLLEGQPTILIANGRILEQNLKKTRMNINDLLEECRLKDVFDISEVEFAILETSGFSVQLKAEHQPVTRRDMKLQAADKGLCLNVVIDGLILYDHLLMADKDKKWLLGEIEKQNVSVESVLLAYIDSGGGLIVQRKNEDKPKNPLV